MSDFIRRLFGHLRINQDRLSISYFVYGISMGLSGLAQIIIFIAAAKWMEVVEFGLLGVILIVLPLLSRGFMLGVDTGYAMRIWRISPSEQQRLLGASVSFLLISATFLLLVAQALSIIFQVWTVFLMACTVLVAGCRSSVDLSLITLRRSGRVLRVGAFQGFRGVCILFFVPITFYFCGADAESYLIGSLFAELTTLFLMTPILLQTSRWHIFEAGWFDQSLSLLKMGIPALPMMLAMLLVASGDRFVIASVLGLSAVAVYTLGQKFAEYLAQIIFAPFITALSPIAWQRATQKITESVQLLNAAAALLICAGSTAIGLVAVVMREVVFFSYGVYYVESTTVFLWVAFACVVAQVSQVFSSYFSHIHKLAIPMKIYLCATAGMLLANYLLVSKVGVIGVAVISALTYLTILAAVIIFARRSGGKLWKVQQHLVPLIVYAIFLTLVGIVDMAGWPSVPAILIKLLFWGIFVYTLLKISIEFRAPAMRVLQHLRILINLA
jgi:O-antigen/teichoic acid export membrane protein